MLYFQTTVGLNDRQVMKFAVLAFFVVGTCLAEVYLKEEFGKWHKSIFFIVFSDDSWPDRWVQSKHKDDYGKFISSSGKWHGDKERDQGIKTSQDARFYALSTRFNKFTNRGKSLVVQFTVKHEQPGFDCGGGYVKVSRTPENP